MTNENLEQRTEYEKSQAMVARHLEGMTDEDKISYLSRIMFASGVKGLSQQYKLISDQTRKTIAIMLADLYEKEGLLSAPFGCSELLKERYEAINKKRTAHVEAAEAFEKKGELEKAAIEYEKAGYFYEAGGCAFRLWKELGNTDRTRACLEKAAREHESEYNHGDAAEKWRRAGNLERCKKALLEQARGDEEGARIFKRKGRVESEAGQYFRSANYLGRAAKCGIGNDNDEIISRAIRNYRLAAKYFEQVGDSCSLDETKRKIEELSEKTGETK